MRWNVSIAALAASWGVISLIVSGVDLGAPVLVFWRLSLAALTIGLVSLALGRRSLLRLPRPAGPVVLVGVVLAAHWFLFFETIKLASVAVAVLTVYTAPIFLALLAPLFLPERRSRVALAALVPAAAGLVLIALAGEGGAHARPLALVTGLAAAITYAGLVIATKRLTATLHPAAIAFWAYAVAAVVLTPALFLSARVLPESALDALGLVGLGIVFTGISGFIYISLLGRVTAQAIGILAFLEPVSAALLAWAALDEPLGPTVLAGGALVLAAGLAIVLYEPAEPVALEAAGIGSKTQ